METKKEKQQHKKEPAKIARAISTRGRIFTGVVTKKFDKRVVIELEKVRYVPKYERFYKKKTRIHARLPATIDVQIGDQIRVQECRPLSKIIHHLVIEKLQSKEIAQ